jgi:hypothetical protein
MWSVPAIFLSYAMGTVWLWPYLWYVAGVTEADWYFTPLIMTMVFAWATTAMCFVCGGASLMDCLEKITKKK